MRFIDAVGVVFVQVLVSIQSVGSFLAEAKSNLGFGTEGLIERCGEIASGKARETGFDVS